MGTYYSTSSPHPSANITKHKSRLKVYNANNVYLKDGDSFEIELFNPKLINILCKVKLNGTYISSSGIVLKPGQRVFLERFIDTNNKFRFSTYEVEDSAEAKTAIMNNGDVTIEFYDEYEPPRQQITWISTSYEPHYYNANVPLTNFDGITTYTANASNISDTTLSYSSEPSNVKSRSSRSFAKQLKKTDSLSTGRVEKGESSNQSFTNYSGSFNTYSSLVVSYKILPYETKVINLDEVKNYCSNCGRRLKKEFKFCPTCGNRS